MYEITLRTMHKKIFIIAEKFTATQLKNAYRINCPYVFDVEAASAK
jgi:hypothetical protein